MSKRISLKSKSKQKIASQRNIRIANTQKNQTLKRRTQLASKRLRPQTKPMSSKSKKKLEDIKKNILVRRIGNQISRNKTNLVKNLRSRFIKAICADSGECIGFGKELDLIKKHFNYFTDSKFLTEITQIGSAASSANGFVRRLKYEHDGYVAYAILKSSQDERGDNIWFEYAVGTFLNEMQRYFPCFLETYNCAKYKSEAIWDAMRRMPVIRFGGGATGINYSLGTQNLLNQFAPPPQPIGPIGPPPTGPPPAGPSAAPPTGPPSGPPQINNFFDDTFVRILPSDICANSKLLAVLIQNLPTASVLGSNIQSPSFIGHDLLYILYQIYFPLSVMADIFTHYDLHIENVLLYKPRYGGYMIYNYHNLDGTVSSFKSQYIAKIIDYGKCFFLNREKPTTDMFYSSSSIYEMICRDPSCNIGNTRASQKRYCGQNNGFQFGEQNTVIGGDDHHINFNKRNISHDLRLIPFIQRYTEMYKNNGKINHDLNELCKKVVYTNTFGTIENTNMSTYRIYNVISMRRELKNLIATTPFNDSVYAGMTLLGTFNIYEDGRPMVFVN